MTDSSFGVSFPYETLAQFGAASGDRSPLHCDDDYARRTPFGAAIIHGSLTLLAMLARTPMDAGSRPFVLDAVYRQPAYPGRPYRIDAAPRGERWRIELLEDDASLATMNVKPAETPDARTPPARAPRPMRSDPATPTAEELAGHPKAFGEYHPDVAALVSLARDYSGGGDVDTGAAAALGWISYCAGMELPGRHSMCRRVKLTVHRPVEPGGGYSSELRVDMYDERTNLMRVSGSLFQGETALADCTLGIHWRRYPEADM